MACPYHRNHGRNNTTATCNTSPALNKCPVSASSSQEIHTSCSNT